MENIAMGNGDKFFGQIDLTLMNISAITLERNGIQN
jgi:hypothetical protein